MTDLRAIAKQLCGTGYAADKMVDVVERAMRLAIEATWQTIRAGDPVKFDRYRFKANFDPSDEQIAARMLELIKAEALKGKWTTSGDGLIFVVGGSVVGTVSKTCNGRLTKDDRWRAYGCMTNWQDTNLGPHSSQLEARKAVTDWVKEKRRGMKAEAKQ